MGDSKYTAGPGESFSQELQTGKATTFRYNRPVRFRLEMVNGSVVEGVIPANSDFKMTPQQGDIVRFDVFIDDLPNSPQSVD